MLKETELFPCKIAVWFYILQWFLHYDLEMENFGFAVIWKRKTISISYIWSTSYKDKTDACSGVLVFISRNIL